MGSHGDMDHGEDARRSEVIKELTLKAELMTELGKNRITADRPLEAWQHEGISVQMLADDPQGVLRISIGGHPEFENSEYCNFRGDQGRCISLLERCLAAMKSHSP